MIQPIELLVGLCGGLLAVFYFFCRVEPLELGKWQLGYIGVNASIGLLCGCVAASTLVWLEPVRLAHFVVLILAMSHLSLCYRPGRELFPVNPEMRIDYQPVRDMEGLKR